MGRWELALFLFLGAASLLTASDLPSQAANLEDHGDALGARRVLQEAANAQGAGAQDVLVYAEFLDLHHDPQARASYRKCLALFSESDHEDRRKVARRLVLLDLIEGDRDQAQIDLAAYRAQAGNDLGSAIPGPHSQPGPETIPIPGPLESFERMAGLPTDLPAQEILTELARNIVMDGYKGASNRENVEPTEYLKLVQRYLAQARELEALAGDRRTIHTSSCNSGESRELLRILGYRVRGGCGADVVLETADATRAFVTIDSGFPLAAFEKSLRASQPFDYEYCPARVPVLFGAAYWSYSPKTQSDEPFIDRFVGDPGICRMYLGFAKLDRETADALRDAIKPARLEPYAPVLDFFGSMFVIRGGKAVVPGGERSAGGWADLAGVSPDRGTQFYARLISRDHGWLAAYFDTLARTSGPAADYLTEPRHLKQFYLALRGRASSPGPARPVFRANSDLMLLTVHLRVNADGTVHIPGAPKIWEKRLAKTGAGDGATPARGPMQADDVVAALFAECRKPGENDVLQAFMAISDLERRRAKPLEAATVARLLRDFHDYGAQYVVLSEAPALRDATIIQFLDAAGSVSRIGDTELRSETAGFFQALAGLWQILCRQGSIPEVGADAALWGVVSGFEKIRDARDVFERGREGVAVLLKAAGAGKSHPEDLLTLLAGGGVSPADPDSAGWAIREQVAREMNGILDSQRLIRLEMLFTLADSIEGAAHGGKMDFDSADRLDQRAAEMRPQKAKTEAASMSSNRVVERHIEAEYKLKLRKSMERAEGNSAALGALIGLLTPFLRDTLVGLNYAYYAPPGAQLLIVSPSFVRSHDFLGIAGTDTWADTDVESGDSPSGIGGRLEGSLAGLPYALADAEQNFLVPARGQALIWADLAPEMILSAKIPRWWNVTPVEVHFVGLHMRYAESLVAEAALAPAVRATVLHTLGRQLLPARLDAIRAQLENGDVRAALDSIAPVELFALARAAADGGLGGDGLFAHEIGRLQQQWPGCANYDAISHDFGTPKPVLTNSYRTSLLYLRTFPTLMGYSSRLMAETWESSALYWAALADELFLAPPELNVQIPEWTAKVIERIFAGDLDDWPALLRAQRTVGDDVRAEYRRSIGREQKASLQ